MTVCINCESDIKRNDKYVKCIVCGLKSHLKCTKLKEEEFSIITANPNINYSCRTCGTIDNVVSSMMNNVKMLLKEQENRFEEQLNLFKDSINGMINSKDNSRSYSEAVRKKKNEKIIVKPTEEQNSKKTKDEITEIIEPEKLAIGVKNIKYVKNGGILINCADKESKNKIKTKMEEVTEKYNIEEPKIKKPTIIVINVEKKYIDKDLGEIKRCISDQNCLLQGENMQKFKVLRKYVKNKSNVGNIILEVENDIYATLLSEERLNIGWKRCKVFEYVNVVRCFKCARYGHFAEKCKNETTCFNCAGSHMTTECQEQYVKCINCFNAKEKLKLNISYDHTAYDRECASYIKIREREFEKINFDL